MARHQNATVSLTAGGSPPAGYFASPTGSPTGSGAIGDPWDLQTAMYGGPGGTYSSPASNVQPGDTVWMRRGTYTGQYVCAVIGTAGHYITFRGYPGERAIVDGNFDNAITGTGGETLQFHNWGAYQIARDIEITNSQVNRMCSPWFDQNVSDGGKAGDARNEGVQLLAHDCKLINCVIHDNGNAMFPAMSAKKWEVSGNLVYYNGLFSPFAEQNQAASVDLVPAGATAVALSGAYHAQQSGLTSITITGHVNAGDYTLVAVAKNGQGYAAITATFDGAAMTLLSGVDGYGGSVAMFGIKGHTTTANVVVNSGDTTVVRAIAQSFVNVNQNASEVLNAVPGGTWWNNQWANTKESSPGSGNFSDPGVFTSPDHYDVGATTTTNTNHMVVDAIGIYSAYGTNYTPSGNNAGHLIGYSDPYPSGPTWNPIVLMSTATRTGVGTVNLQWGWDMRIYGHGHGSYDQTGGSQNVVTISGDHTVTGPSGTWTTADVGGQITIEGAGVAGVRYTTTISAWNSSSSIEVANDVNGNPPSTSLGSTEASWSFGSILKDNIFLQSVSYSTQTYGSSGAAFCGADVSGNLFAQNYLVLGGLAGFRMTDSVVHDNYSFGIGTNIGYETGNMRNYRFENNYMTNAVALGVASGAYDDMGISGNTFIGTAGSTLQTDFTSNTYLASDPTTNHIVILPNDYEANRANIYVYNWQNLTTVSVDISSAVAVGTPIRVMDAQNYYGTPIWTGTYGGGSITLPQTGTLSDLVAAAAIGGAGGTAGATFTPAGTTAPAFAAFIVRAQSTETWR